MSFLQGKGFVHGGVSGDGTGITDAVAFRGGLEVTSAERVAFFDRFDDRTRYPEGTFLTDGVTMPLYGSVWKWKKNDGAAPADMKMLVANGALRAQRLGGGYLAAHATPEDHQDWSAGWFFTRELTRHATNTIDASLTITVGSAPLVGASTHSAPGNWHVNFNETGIASQGIYETSYAVTVDNVTDEITLGAGSNSPAPIATGDYVNIGGSVVPSGTAAATDYWAILVSGNGGTGSVVKLATSRANALAGTALPLTSNGTSVTLARNPEAINRQYLSSVVAWLPPRSETRKFTGSAGADTLTITTHYFAANQPVIVEGDGLPGGLAGGTVYYVRDVTANTIKLSLTPGGSAIDLTTNGTANQYIRGLAMSDSAVGCMPAGRNNLIIFRRKGDYLTWELAGVGEITFYFRGSDSFMGSSGEVGFYYQTPPEQSSGQNFTQTYPIKAAWIDAPGIESDYRKQHAGYVAALATGSRHFLPGRLELTPENTREFGASMVSTLKANYGWATFSGAASLADATNSKFKFVGGNHYAEGVYAVNWSFPDAGTALLGICPATFDCTLDATVANAINTTDATLKTFDSAMPLEAGDIEEVTINGFLTGANAKRIKIQMFQNSGLGSIFDSGLGVLNLLATPFTIRFTRKASASQTHIIYAEMLVNGTVIGPQRFAGNLSMDYRYYEVLTTCADAGAVTLETIRRTVHRNNIR
jgi:hypothetical protein